MATRGWTPRAASGDPHDFPCTAHGDPVDFCSADAPVELRVKVRSSFCVPCHVVNTRPVLTERARTPYMPGTPLLVITPRRETGCATTRYGSATLRGEETVAGANVRGATKTP
jgi:hypothetical protein